MGRYERNNTQLFWLFTVDSKICTRPRAHLSGGLRSTEHKQFHPSSSIPRDQIGFEAEIWLLHFGLVLYCVHIFRLTMNFIQTTTSKHLQLVNGRYSRLLRHLVVLGMTVWNSNYLTVQLRTFTSLLVAKADVFASYKHTYPSTSSRLLPPRMGIRQCSVISDRTKRFRLSPISGWWPC